MPDKVNPLLQREINRSLNAIMGMDSFEQAAKTIFDSCKVITGGTAGYVALLSETGEENEVLFLDAGGRECTVDESLPMPIRGLRGVAYAQGKAVYDNDFNNSQWLQFIPEGHVKMDNVMFAPLIIEEKVVGVIGLANKNGDFTEEDAANAATFGQLASVAMFKAHERERYKEFEQKIHDRIAELTCRGKSAVEHDQELARFKQELNSILRNIND